ncbi:hypothetical protein D3C80_1137870 [compost metagenome]
MLGQFFGQAEAQAQAVADPVQAVGQHTPQGNHQGKHEHHRQPVLAGREQCVEFVLGLVDFFGPAIERAVVANQLFFKTAQRAAEYTQYALLGWRLGQFGTVAQLLQVGQ